MVPLSTLISVSAVIGPQLVPRYNQFTSAGINGEAAPGFSSGEAMDAMERVADATLPDGYGYEWSGMSLQERKSGGQAPVLFLLALLFAYLFLVIASGAGANSRRAIGTTVFSGMLAATLIGIFLIPALYVVFQAMREKVWRKV